jgi:hypothetical protein
MRALAFGIVTAGAIGTAAAAEPLLLSDVQLERITAGLTNTLSSVMVTRSSCVNGSCSVTTSQTCVNGSCSVTTSQTSTSQTSTSETGETARALPVSANGLQPQLAFASAWATGLDSQVRDRALERLQQQLVSMRAHWQHR